MKEEFEDNNGWIKIESEVDRKYTGYAFVLTKREDISQVSCQFFDGEIKYFYATHYQPIIKPNEPLY